MALDATIGGVSSNSYVTLAEATAYFADRSHVSAWTACTFQSAALITASRQLDWYVMWNGEKASGTQALDWPRTGVYDEFGEEYAETVLPEKLKQAVYELALSSISADRMEDPELSGIAEARAGSLMVKADSAPNKSTPKVIPPKVWKILKNLGCKAGGSAVRLVRG